jgi:hypothetical protein
LNHNFFGAAFECYGGSKFGGYVETNAEPFCVEFCNFVQCNAFVNYLSSYYQM